MAEEVKIVIKADDKASGPLKKINTAFKDMTGISLSAAAGIGLMGKGVQMAGKFLADSVKDTVAYAKSVRDMGRALGVSAEEASTLIQVADDLMIPLGSLELGFKTALRQGISPTVDGLKELAVEYQALPTPTEKAQFALEKFGRAGLEMQKILELTPQAIDEMAQSAEDAGLIMDQQGVNAAREYEKAMDALGDSFEGVKMKVGNALVPAITEATNVFNKFVTALGKSDREFDLLSDAFDATIISMDEYEDWGNAITFQTEKVDEIVRIVTARMAAYNETMRAGNDYRKDYLAAGGSYVIQVEEEAVTVDILTTAVLGLAGSYDAANTAAGLLSGGLKAITDDMVEQERIKLVLKIATEELTGAEIEELLNQQTTLENMQKLNQALEDDIITKYDWIAVMSDGIITQQEMNNLLGESVGPLAVIKNGLIEAGNEAATASQKVYSFGEEVEALDGKEANVTIRFTVLGETPEILGGQFNFQHGGQMIVPPGYPNDSLRIGVSSGEYVSVTPANQVTNNNNFNMTVNSNSRMDQTIANFEIMRALAR